jgi:release factor glutamine methyltransferase
MLGCQGIISEVTKAEAAIATSGSASPRLDAELLMAHALSMPRSELYSSGDANMSDGARLRYWSLVDRRVKAEPMAYIIGKREFWSMDVRVTRDVLIPRPETETVVEAAIEIAKAMGGELRIFDICTGSGNIAMALASELPRARFVISDISEAAIEVARENTSFTRGRIDARVGDLFSVLNDGEEFSIITANPPYVSAADRNSLSREITEYEPTCALFSEEGGLALPKDILVGAPRYLVSDGSVVMEIGLGQYPQLAAFAQGLGYREIRARRDLAGIDRVIIAKAPR